MLFVTKLSLQKKKRERECYKTIPHLSARSIVGYVILERYKTRALQNSNLILRRIPCSPRSRNGITVDLLGIQCNYRAGFAVV